MAKIKFLFCGTDRSMTQKTTLETFCTLKMSEIMIVIKEEDEGMKYICLDRDTAIKFSKELRKQIALISI